MKPLIATLLLTATLVSMSGAAARAELITNGGFESGFSGWTTVDQLGSEGTFALQSGTSSPVNGDAVPAPPGGLTAAMTDAAGPGSHILYQSFMATSPVPTTILSFDVFVGNRADAFFAPPTLDFSTPTLNQQARVDILLGSADPFSVAAADVLLNAFQTQPGDPLVSGYTHVAVDITSLLNSNLNTALLLRFAEVDNVFIFQLGVDNVSIAPAGAQAVPEPSAAALLVASALLGIGVIASRRARMNRGTPRLDEAR
jgi:hypothetical protein